MNDLISKGIKKIKDSFVDSDEPINEENPEIELAMEKQGVFSFQNRELLNKYVDDFQLLHDHYFPTGVVGNWKDVSTANMDKVQFSVIAESGLTVDVILGGEDMFLHYSSQDDLDYLAKQLYSMIFRIIGMYDWQEVSYTGFLIKNHLNHAEILRAWHKDEDQLITLAQNLYMQHIVPDYPDNHADKLACFSDKASSFIRDIWKKVVNKYELDNTHPTFLGFANDTGSVFAGLVFKNKFGVKTVKVNIFPAPVTNNFSENERKEYLYKQIATKFKDHVEDFDPEIWAANQTKESDKSEYEVLVNRAEEDKQFFSKIAQEISLNYLFL